MEQILREGFAELGLAADERALRRFRRYAELLEEKNEVMNLTAIRGEEAVARLHFLDCAALLTVEDFGGRRVIDVGTGAGFPGLVLKILRPELELTLLDSLDKRVAFLRGTAAELGLEGITFLHARAEEAPEALRGGFDLALSRAVARLSLLSELCLPLVKTGGAMIAMKGPDPREELEEARKGIRLLGGEPERCVEYRIPGAGVTHSAVVVRKRADTPKGYPRRWAQMKKKPLGL
ncbi:MAG: 16S rRNA (guanine(527)-N(7))-methyltransferase RsmG [Oscillospiraceae bacterium]|nr:16S rRNA (guanine(527)-N(7))-methyltransferase RsmG [Oscillospiraceae bacterium]